MIQRIQSVYLLLAALSSALMFAFPIGWYYGSSNTIEFYVYRIIDHVPGNEQLFAGSLLIPLIILVGASLLLPLLIIFDYKRLSRQLSWIRIQLLLLMVMVALIFFVYNTRLNSLLSVEADFGFGMFLPLIAMVFSFLAMRAVQRDQKLLRSVDRLR